MLITGLLLQHTGQSSRPISPLQSEPLQLIRLTINLVPAGNVSTSFLRSRKLYYFVCQALIDTAVRNVDRTVASPTSHCWGTTLRVNTVLSRQNVEDIRPSSASTPVTTPAAASVFEAGAESQRGHFPALIPQKYSCTLRRAVRWDTARLLAQMHQGGGSLSSVLTCQHCWHQAQ